jgi:hypothetical protein
MRDAVHKYARLHEVAFGLYPIALMTCKKGVPVYTGAARLER